jgi:hypothetical protein
MFVLGMDIGHSGGEIPEYQDFIRLAVLDTEARYLGLISSGGPSGQKRAGLMSRG